MSIRLKRVDGWTHEEDLEELQLVCLPEDDPRDTTEGAWWIAYDGNIPVAFAGISHIPKLNWGYLCRAGVVPEYRGRGLQRRLIDVRLRHAKKNGWPVVVCDTHLTNHSSSNNLFRRGFKLYEPEGRWAFKDGLYWRYDFA